MPSRPRDERRTRIGQAIYALTVIIVIPAVMLIEVRMSRLARAYRRPPALDFRHDFRPMPHGPNMDVPAIIRPTFEIKPLTR